MKFPAIAQLIIELKDADLALRLRLAKDGHLGNGYHQEMQQLHAYNTQQLDAIIDEVGYPTSDKVGHEASEAAWLIIQHSIGNPNFMKKCALLLKKAVEGEKGNTINLAYLIDRIRTFEDRDQLYGTSFDWDENDQLNPTTYDDIIRVNERRMSIGMNSLEEQIEIIKNRAKADNEVPNDSYEDRQLAYNNWRKSVGWIT